MPAGGDIIELVHEQTYLGQQINNVYYFEAIDGTASLTALATWFETNLVPDIKSIQVDLVTHVNLRLRNIFALAETYEDPLTGTGAQISGAVELPAFFAWQIRLDHVLATVRPGFKRYTGLYEAGISDALIDASVMTVMGTIAAELVNPPATANVGWAHVIVNRICEELNPVIGAVPRCLKYRLPNAQVESDPGYPTSYEVYSQPTTQNSRKWYT